MVAVKTRSTGGAKLKTVHLDKIRLDGDTQSRKELDEDVIKQYADLIADGTEFPPLEVVFDGADYWLVDGFHRRWAAVKQKLKAFKCRVVQGTREDARWMSYGCNEDHGLPRTNDDKMKAVLAALKHPKGAKMSDQKIAEHVGVNHSTVAKYRKQLEASCEISKIEERTVTRGGTTYTQNTANIGKTQRDEALARAAANGTRAGAVASSTPARATSAAVPACEDDDPNEHVREQIENERATGDMNKKPEPDWKGLLDLVAQARRAADKINVMLGRKGKFCEQFQDTCGILDDIVRDWRKVK